MPDRPLPFDQPVFVTRPLLPPLEGFVGRLRDVWSSGWLANGGAQHQAGGSQDRQHPAMLATITRR